MRQNSHSQASEIRNLPSPQERRARSQAMQSTNRNTSGAQSSQGPATHPLNSRIEPRRNRPQQHRLVEPPRMLNPMNGVSHRPPALQAPATHPLNSRIEPRGNRPQQHRLVEPPRMLNAAGRRPPHTSLHSVDVTNSRSNTQGNRAEERGRSEVVHSLNSLNHVEHSSTPQNTGRIAPVRIPSSLLESPSHLSGSNATLIEEGWIDEEDQLEESHTTQNEWGTIFDLARTGPVIQGPVSNVTLRGKLRTEPFGPTEIKQKRKNFNRAMAAVSERLDLVARLHPEVEFMLYARTKGKRNVLKVSKGLAGIDSSRWFAVIHNALNEYSMSDDRLPMVSYAERYASDLPTASYDTAWLWFEKKQTARSMKAIYYTLESKGLVRPRGENAKLEWYKDSFKEWFKPIPVSPVPTTPPVRKIWDALKDLQFNGSMGNGKQFKELTRVAYIGLLQVLDLLAAARSESPLPNLTDSAGNPMQGNSETRAPSPNAGNLDDNLNFEPDVPQPGFNREEVVNLAADGLDDSPVSEEVLYAN